LILVVSILNSSIPFEGVLSMATPRALVRFGLFALVSLVPAQTAPTSYSISQNINMPGATSTVYRNGSKALIVTSMPAQGSTPASRSSALYDIGAGVSYSWNPDDKNVPCGANHFSGDWGDPFAQSSDVEAAIQKGDLKPAGNETIDGIAANVYAGTTEGANVKAWLDAKDGLVLRAEMSAPGAAPMRVIDVTKVSFAAPAASLFALPAVCTGVKPPPTPAELIADETGDDAANYVSAFTGPGSKDNCDVVLRVVQAKTMTPLTNVQVAIDTQYDQNDPNPPHYEFGVGNDGTETFAGGHLHQITTGIHDGVVDLGSSLPAYFNMVVNAVHPGHSGGSGLFYRQCFAPTTVLLFLYKDYAQSGESVDALWVKSGKYATPPAH
jgi:hypothetical protein